MPTLMCSQHPHATGPGTCFSLWGGTQWPWLPGSVPMQLQLPAAGSPVPLGLCRRQARLQGSSEPPLCRELPVLEQAPGSSWQHWDPFPPQKYEDPWGALPGLYRAMWGRGVRMPTCILSHPVPLSSHATCPRCSGDTSLPPTPSPCLSFPQDKATALPAFLPSQERGGSFPCCFPTSPQPSQETVTSSGCAEPAADSWHRRGGRQPSPASSSPLCPARSPPFPPGCSTVVGTGR